MKQPITSESPLFLCGARAKTISKVKYVKGNNKEFSTERELTDDYVSVAATPPDGISPEGCDASDLLVKSSAPRELLHLADPITGINIQMANGSGGNTCRAFLTVQLLSQQDRCAYHRLTCHMTQRHRDFARDYRHPVDLVARRYLKELENDSADHRLLIGHVLRRNDKMLLPGWAAVFNIDTMLFRLFVEDQVFDTLISPDNLTSRQSKLYIAGGAWGNVILRRITTQTGLAALNCCPEYTNDQGE